MKTVERTITKRHRFRNSPQNARISVVYGVTNLAPKIVTKKTKRIAILDLFS